MYYTYFDIINIETHFTIYFLLHREPDHKNHKKTIF